MLYVLFVPQMAAWIAVMKRKEQIIMGEIDDVIGMLDNLAQGGVSRIKVETSESVADGEVKKAYHHGRCDVGSPFATGKLFDAEESDCG